MRAVRYGFVLPGGPARQQVELAVLAEQSGWDAVFVFEAAYVLDSWSLLSAMAERTDTLRLGTMLTPLPWRRPWKVASQAVTLDHLSGGRAILSVGLGAPETGWGGIGDARPRAERARLLDEGIDLIAELWSGGLRYSGERFDLDLTKGPFPPLRPVQEPRIPIWVVGAWPHERSMRRALRCDGLIPVCMDPTFRPTGPPDIEAMLAWLDANGGRRHGFDVVVEGETPPAPAGAAEIVEPFSAAGATWWLEARWMVAEEDRYRVISERLAAGPPTA
ncbi:MAG TPA: LLM class flavin-dependent oxidoreductase [Acidimicrobiales bacterium]|nr:LLM class flavin-dependent oxidoreductase [Acidimicrobiales bacterium]